MHKTLKTHVYLNVYDLIQQNEYVYWAGFGAFHSGVVLLDKEIAFGHHPYDTSGIFATPPGAVPGATLRETIDLGEIEITQADLKALMEKLGKSFTGKSYHILRRNCNHFSDEFVRELRGEGIPSWINRTSWWVSAIECCIPNKYLPKTPSEEIESQPTQCTNCSCGHSTREKEWNEQGRSLSDSNNAGLYAPLPQDNLEKRQMVERMTLERLKRG